jgi:hypothetical protein
MENRLTNLGRDLWVFTQICFYWPFAITVMLPAKAVDRRLGTKMFPALDRWMRAIAGE